MKVKVKHRRRHCGPQRPALDRRSLGPDFRRVRIGIGHPGRHKDQVTPHVLGNYAKSEMEPLVRPARRDRRRGRWLADGDDARFMSEVALRLQQD